MRRSLAFPLTGLLVAVAVTTTMDASGLSLYSALPLLPIAGALWWIQRLPRTAVGLTLGRPIGYGLAILHPLVVIGGLTLIASAMGVAHPEHVGWGRVASRLLIASTAGALVVMLTEEGFFRGWFWGALRAAAVRERTVLFASSLAFMLWHISAVTLDTGFNPPPRQVPVFLANAFFLGVIWGLLRSVSGSIIVPSVCHSVWNAVAYSLYGFGTKTGALGIRDTAVFAPEVGALGLALNAGFAIALYYAMRNREPLLRQ